MPVLCHERGKTIHGCFMGGIVLLVWNLISCVGNKIDKIGFAIACSMARMLMFLSPCIQ